MAIRLFDYQLEAIKNCTNGSILCGGVGSGKSLTSLGYYYKFNGGSIGKDGSIGLDMFKPQDLYIITTAHKRDTLEWHQEILALHLSTDPKFNYYKNNVVIDSWNNIEKYKNVQHAFFIFDEQRVVGYGKWTKTFLKICKSNNWILLSATPGDTWSDYIPVFIANGFYKNKTEFNDQHVVWNAHVPYPCVSRYLNTKKLEALRARILIDMSFNRPTSQHDVYIEVEYDKTVYKNVIKTHTSPFEKLKVFDSEIPKPIETAAEFCQTLRHVVNSDPSRGKEVIKICNSNDRVIIFYNYNFELDILKSLAYRDGTIVAEWNGTKHDKVPNSEKWVYLVQYNAGAEGWNCITTNCMIFYSEHYSYRMMTQAKGRIDRLNTPFKDLYYYHMRSYSHIDAAIKRSLEQKQEFNARAFSKGIVFGKAA